MTKKQSQATKQANAQRAAERAAAMRREQERRERRRRSLVVGVTVLGVLVVTGLIAVLVQVTRDEPGGEKGQVAAAPAGVVEEFAVPLGPDDAPVTVEVYEDFLCPFCAQFELSAGNTLKQYAAEGDVQVQFKSVAFLDGLSEGTDYSTRAMNAVGVVLDTSGREAALEMHDRLFANQPAEGTPGLSDDELIELAVESEARRTAVADPIRNLKFEAWVADATDAASQADVSSTPTVLVNGEVVEGGSIPEVVQGTEAAIEAALD